MYDVYSKFGYTILSAYTKEHNVVKDAIDFMVEHYRDARWDIIADSIKIMEKGFAKKEHCTCEFTEWIINEAQKQFEQDMIYYTICYDGFRL